MAINIPEMLKALVHPGRGFQGFLCEYDQSQVDALGCLYCARAGAPAPCQMTAPVIAGMIAGLRDDDFGLSVTTLIHCARKARLRRQAPYWSKPSDLWWIYRGQLMHDVARTYAEGETDVIAEQRFSMLVELSGGALVEISGQPDLIYTDRRHLVDYKTTKRVPGTWKQYRCPDTGELLYEGGLSWQRKYIKCPNCEAGEHEARLIMTEGPRRPYSGHAAQVSLYRLLLAENGIPVDSAEIVYQDMAEQIRLDIPLMPLEDAYAYLTRRVAAHTTSDLPPVEESWECDYCTVRATCDGIRSGILEPPMDTNDSEA